MKRGICGHLEMAVTLILVNSCKVHETHPFEEEDFPVLIALLQLKQLLLGLSFFILDTELLEESRLECVRATHTLSSQHH